MSMCLRYEPSHEAIGFTAIRCVFNFFSFVFALICPWVEGKYRCFFLAMVNGYIIILVSYRRYI